MIEATLLAECLNEAISRGLPGVNAHTRMLPKGRNLLSSGKQREAAVLLLLYPKNNNWWIVCIKRNQYDGPHSGQISFPGGKKDKLDESLLQTALRETLEETGVDSSLAIIAGMLTPLHIPVSGFLVYPFIAILKNSPSFFPDKDEVQYLIEIPLVDLLNPSVIMTKKMNLQNGLTDVPCFAIKDELIWGATAMILSEFIELLPRAIFDY